MPSTFSRSAGLATGRATSVGVTVSVPQTAMLEALVEIWVCPWFSPAVPVTVTRSPTETRSWLPPLKTKMPSEVAGSPSPESWR